MLCFDRSCSPIALREAKIAYNFAFLSAIEVIDILHKTSLFLQKEYEELL